MFQMMTAATWLEGNAGHYAAVTVLLQAHRLVQAIMLQFQIYISTASTHTAVLESL